MKEAGVFCFLDEIVELKRNESITAFYKLKGDEEFLKDHFGVFPVMPGVLLLEALKQAASRLLAFSGDSNRPFYRMVNAENVKFGQFVKPGTRLRIAASLMKEEKPFRPPSLEASERFYFFEGRIDCEKGRALQASFVLVPVGD
ncbi:MAG: hypothetical protein HY593_04400 [Candidatus Omnitrophica bacterium]|nr:hypothetical protein [Candidatus Omnitrophota bacterium]